MTGAPLPRGAVEHIHECQRCREFQAFWDLPTPAAEVPPEIQTRIAQQIVTGLRPVSPLPSNLVLIALLLLLAVVAIATGVWWLGEAGWQALAPLQSAVVFSFLGTGVLLIAHVVIRQMVPGARQWIATPVAITGVLASILTAVLLFFPYKPNPDFVSAGLRCWGRGLLVATGAAVLFFLVLRRGAWLSPMKLGAATGCLAGLVGLTVLEINCPNLDRAHIGFWHLGAALTATLIGAATPAISIRFRSWNQVKTP
ncbi:MAG: NrsF family protein [Bryobacteraceae bacterium]